VRARDLYSPAAAHLFRRLQTLPPDVAYPLDIGIAQHP
jgi:hypothetical protein